MQSGTERQPNGNRKKAREEEAPSKIQRLFLFRCGGGVDGNGGWCRKSKTERKKRKKNGRGENRSHINPNFMYGVNLWAD